MPHIFLPFAGTTAGVQTGKHWYKKVLPKQYFAKMQAA
jgi:hypothetical protein